MVSSNNGVDNVHAFVAASGFPFDLVLGYDGKGLAKGRPHIERAAARLRRRPRTTWCSWAIRSTTARSPSARACASSGVAGTFSRERFALRFPGRRWSTAWRDIAGLVA